MNGLLGRMLRMPAPKGRTREILLVCGHHTSLERIYSIAEYLNGFGGVCVPDLPGLGGMDPFYKIGEKPTLDNYADYLASFVKLRYRGRRVTIFAISWGFAAVTRMLQKYPEIAKRVDLLVSISGFVHKKDFIWKKSSIFVLGGTAWLLSNRLLSWVVKTVFIRRPVIKALYRAAEKINPKLKNSDQIKRREQIDFEIKLWKINDFRTYLYIGSRGFTMVPLKKHVGLSVYHVAVDEDHYFNNVLVEQHMRQIYKDFEMIKSVSTSHAPTIIATSDEVATLVPPLIQRLLRKRV